MILFVLVIIFPAFISNSLYADVSIQANENSILLVDQDDEPVANGRIELSVAYYECMTHLNALLYTMADRCRGKQIIELVEYSNKEGLVYLPSVTSSKRDNLLYTYENLHITSDMLVSRSKAITTLGQGAALSI